MPATKPFDGIPAYHDTHGMRPAIAHINIAHLKHNFRLLKERIKGHANDPEIMAVVKANAYGHGLDLVAPALFDAGCRHFAVTDAAEGAAARRLLPDADSIVLLSSVFDGDDAELSRLHRLTPVITEAHQATLLHQAQFTGAVWIKINTGMQRLGANDPAALIAQCRDQGLQLAGIMSHLACADTPEHPLNHAQADEFLRLHRELAPESPASLLNSAGLVTLPDHCHQFVRPGIALYGAEPVPEEPLGLKPVMQLTGQVLHIRELTKGVSLSYGASFTAPEAMRVAIVSLGYGDGLPRQLSNRGMGYHQGAAHPIVGRVCMDFCLLDCTHTPLNMGDSVEFWGEQQTATSVADSVDTISYELFTGVNRRVYRRAA